jgi:hypothetical protein
MSPSLRLPRSRTEALRLKVPRYFSGRRCTNGHIAEKYTLSGNCCECSGIRNASPEMAAYRKSRNTARTLTARHVAAAPT